MLLTPRRRADASAAGRRLIVTPQDTQTATRPALRPEAMSTRISVCGTGYVGLVRGAVLAEAGHDVLCVDMDAAEIAGLRRGAEDASRSCG